MKKALIYVDGQNLFHAIKSMGVYERDIKWHDFFNSLLPSHHELLRVYWFRPNQPGRAAINDNISKEYATDPSDSAEVIQITKNAKKWYDDAKRSFHYIQNTYKKLFQEYENIEGVYKGVVRLSPYKNFKGEKGVDVAMAVHMIKMSDKIDVIYIISGDYDYAEAIQYIKDKMKQVIVVYFDCNEKYVSQALITMVDGTRKIPVKDFLKYKK